MSAKLIWQLLHQTSFTYNFAECWWNWPLVSFKKSRIELGVNCYENTSTLISLRTSKSVIIIKEQLEFFF